MYFKVIDKTLLKKYIRIWERVSSLMNIEFDSEPVYGDNDKYIKTKKHMEIKQIQIFKITKYQKKRHHTGVCH